MNTDATSRGARLLSALAIVVVGLLGRSAVDKALALRAGADGVALWGQTSSVLDLVVGIVASGIGNGLAVLSVRNDPARRAPLLRAALWTGGLLSAATGLMLLLAALLYPAWSGTLGLPPSRIALAAAAGIVLTLGSLTNSYWLGLQRLRPLLAFAATVASVSLLASALAPPAWIVPALVAAQMLPALAALAWVARDMGDHRRSLRSPVIGNLLRYVPAGLAVGLLGPASMLAARSVTAHALSWHAAGQLQALWRVSDWVTSIASGILSVLYLPRLSAANGTARWIMELRAATRAVLPWSALALAALAVLRVPVFDLLYGPGFVPDAWTATLFFGGSLLRVAAWVPLFALYAQGRSTAIVLGEFASLPLFALILALAGTHLTLHAIGAAWLAAYATYAIVNFALLAAGRRVDFSIAGDSAGTSSSV